METGTAVDISSVPGSTHLQVVAGILSVRPGTHYAMQIGVDPLVTQILAAHKADQILIDSNERINPYVKSYQDAHCFGATSWGGVGLLVEMSRHVTREQIQQAGQEESDVIVGRHVQLMVLDGDLRGLQAQIAMCLDCTRILVCHDTQDRSLFGNLMLPPGWFWTEVRDYSTWTSVASKDEALHKLLKPRFVSAVTLTTLEGKEWLS